MDKQDTPQTFWLQRGSFTTVVVDNEKANPEWGRKPFKVIEIHAIEQLQSQLTAAQAEIAELKELIKREVVPDIKDAEIARLQSALDVAVEGLELVKADSSRPLGEIAGYFYSKETYDEVSSALDKIKQIRK